MGGAAAFALGITLVVTVVDFDEYERKLNQQLRAAQQIVIDTVSPFINTVSPTYYLWILKKMDENLQEPPGWTNDDILKNYVCEHSGHLTIFPVFDPCAHLFDYRFIAQHLKNADYCPKYPEQRLVGV